MKTKIYLAILIASAIINNANAQYFEWAHEFPIATKGTNAGEITTDYSGNLITIHHSHFCQVCYESIVTKTDPSGTVIFSVSGFSMGNYSFGSVATDFAGNIYVTGSHNTGTFIIGAFSTISTNWVVKLNAAGTVIWLHDLNDFFLMAADSAGNLYFTNSAIHHTYRLNKTNAIEWIDSTHGGKDIAVDNFHRCYILSDTTVIRYTSIGKIFYNKKFGGDKIAVNKNGNAYILSSLSGLRKLKQGGQNAWNLPSVTGSDVAANDSAVYVASGTQISKWKYDASFEWTFSSDNAPFTNIAIDNNKNIYTDGNYDMGGHAHLCPFKLPDIFNGTTSNFQSFAAKISGSLPIPYQLGIFTGDLYQNYANLLCKNTPLFNIPFTYCLNSVSTLDPSNEFRVQISPDNFSAIIYDVGTPAIVNIPNSIPSNVGYRLRVVATVPPVNGYPNSSTGPSTAITLRDNETTVTASGPLTFCEGDSVTLTALFQTYTTGVAWYNGLTFISNDTSITVTLSGVYKCLFFNSCPGESPPVSVVVLPSPDASYTASGPLTFCAGDSVVLTANAATGLYHWRKNGFGIPGEFNSHYAALTAGTYNLKVTNSDGCTKFGLPVIVTVPCRQSDEGISQSGFVKIFPQPVHDILTIDIHDFSGKGWLHIINETGQTVISKEINFDDEGLRSIEMSNYSGGVYTVIVQSLEQREIVRVVKE